MQIRGSIQSTIYPGILNGTVVEIGKYNVTPSVRLDTIEASYLGSVMYRTSVEIDSMALLLS